MAQKTTAVLLTDNNNVVTTQTAPESILPITLGALLLDIIESNFNRADDAPLVIPSAFTGLVTPSSTANQLFQALLDKSDALQILIQGGVQGQPGEFVAIVADFGMQIVNPIGFAATSSAAIAIKFPNDSDNGGFDNGNNFLLSKYVTPTTGFSGIFTVSGFVLKLLTAIGPGGYINMQIDIVKNRLTAPVILASEASIAQYDDTSVVGEERPATDFVVGNPGVPIVLIANDTIEAILTMTNNAASANKLQIISGLFTAQKV